MLIKMLKTYFMKKHNYLVMATLAFLTVFSFASCEKNSDNDVKGKATVQLMLTDAPALYDNVNIDIQEILLRSDGDTASWISVPLVNPGVYNLLDFSNGLDTLLGTVEIPEGTLTQMRLVLGSNNSIVVDGVTYPLTIPSGSTSGLKFNVNADLEGDTFYRFWIDFDAAHSIHQTGNGKYMLKPVIRMFGEATSGAIDGTVFPAEALPVVTVYNATDTMMAIPNEAGYFKVFGLPAGLYSVEFSTGDTNLTYLPQTFFDVPVVVGTTTTIDTVTLVLP